jgi:hypothetical protein
MHVPAIWPSIVDSTFCRQEAVCSLATGSGHYLDAITCVWLHRQQAATAAAATPATSGSTRVPTAAPAWATGPPWSGRSQPAAAWPRLCDTCRPTPQC